MAITDPSEEDIIYQRNVERANDLIPEVVTALTTVTGQTPREIGPLNEAVDPDALLTLFSRQDSGLIKFELADCHVTVYADGKITVEEIDNIES
ncbi:HalOD1 output domain-containing protein [Halorussus salinus]|uniref:HalOD1 output domain-containing protein n=1 Tax=Halorussus salinus TaxID=1364935 RepID=UPI001091F281|nr:HalOD1 output domain-containing protein [Halorussus salinus]